MGAPESRERELRAETYGKPPSRVLARVTEFDRAARLRRAASIFFPLLGGALLALPIPAVHLAAVPGLLIAGIVLGIQRLRQTSRLERLAGPCPGCASDQEFPTPARLVLPLTLRCPSCGEFVKLEDPHAEGELR